VFSLLNWSLGWLLPAVGGAHHPDSRLAAAVHNYIVNTVLLWLADKLLASFEIKSVRALLLSSSAITLVNWLFHFPLWR